MACKNVGKIDRTMRLIIGVALLSLFVLIDGPAQWLGVLGIVALVTSAVGLCPLYSILKLNTCAVRDGTGSK